MSDNICLDEEDFAAFYAKFNYAFDRKVYEYNLLSSARSSLFDMDVNASFDSITSDRIPFVEKCYANNEQLKRAHLVLPFVDQIKHASDIEAVAANEVLLSSYHEVDSSRHEGAIDMIDETVGVLATRLERSLREDIMNNLNKQRFLRNMVLIKARKRSVEHCERMKDAVVNCVRNLMVNGFNVSDIEISTEHYGGALKGRENDNTDDELQGGDSMPTADQISKAKRLTLPGVTFMINHPSSSDGYKIVTVCDHDGGFSRLLDHDPDNSRMIVVMLKADDSAYDYEAFEKGVSRFASDVGINRVKLAKKDVVDYGFDEMSR